MRPVLLALLSGYATLLASCALALPQYHMIEIPSFGTSGGARSIRSDGSILYAGFPAKVYRLGHGFENLPFGYAPSGGPFQGDKYGRLGYTGGTVYNQATLREADGTVQQVEPISGFDETQFVAMNNNRMIIGHSKINSTAEYWGFAYSNGVRTDLNPGGGYAWPRAADINDNGTVVFFSNGSSLAGRKDQGFFYRNGVYTGFGSVPGLGFDLAPLAINNREDIIVQGSIGFRQPDGSYVRVSPTSPAGYRKPQIYDLNDHGLVVGEATPNEGGFAQGIVTDGYTTSRLKDLLVGDITGVTSAAASQITNEGWLLGGFHRGGKGYSAVFIPVPEPTTWLAMGVGLVAVIRRRRK